MPKRALRPNDLATSMETIAVMMMFTMGMKKRISHQPGRPPILQRK